MNIPDGLRRIASLVEEAAHTLDDLRLEQPTLATGRQWQVARIGANLRYALRALRELIGEV